MEHILPLLDNNLSNLYIPTPGIIDILEIAIISFILYHILVWMRTTRAWFLMRGIVIIMALFVIAAVLQMNTIIWIAQNVVYLGVIAVIVVLQPELRRALETLGKKDILGSFFPVDFKRADEGLFSDRTIQEIAKACVEMSKVKTGALIVVAQNDLLTEYENTGIQVDAIVSSQLLINIFEHNTPLHDGAVIVKGNRIQSATCYLPLSDNMQLSKELGTRHRAGVGVSEATDAMTLIVSEETGKISVAYRGDITRNLKMEDIERQLCKIQNKPKEEKKKNILNRSRNKGK